MYIFIIIIIIFLQYTYLCLSCSIQVDNSKLPVNSEVYDYILHKAIIKFP